MIDDINDPRHELYGIRYGTRIVSLIAPGASGVHGHVMSTDRFTAVKFFREKEGYMRERDHYTLLTEARVQSILGHHVPQKKQFDDELLAIEMSIVKPPYLLDFAGAYREGAEPYFTTEELEEYNMRMSERFEERWPHVEAVLAELERLTGIVYLDPNHDNITFLPPKA